MARAAEQDKQKQNTETTQSQGSRTDGPRLQVVNGTLPTDARIGDHMRATRLAEGIEIEEVAHKLRLNRDYILAMEEMQPARLPKGFVNPYVRDYARVLGLDPQATVDAFNAQCGALSQASNEAPQAKSDPTKPKSNFALTAAVIGVLLAAAAGAGFVVWSNTSDTEIVTPSAPAAVIADDVDGSILPVTATPTLAASTTKLDLEVRANRRAWIEVRGADGTLFIDRTLSTGEVYDLRVGAGWTLTTKDAGAFSWVIGGEAVSSMGADNQAVYSLNVDKVAAGLTAEQTEAQ